MTRTTRLFSFLLAFAAILLFSTTVAWADNHEGGGDMGGDAAGGDAGGDMGGDADGDMGGDAGGDMGDMGGEGYDANGYRKAKNAVYIEGLGHGLLWSLNYDRIIIDQIAARVGFSYYGISASATSGGQTASASADFFLFPITVSYVGLYSGSHGLETGVGGTLIYATAAASGLGTSTEGSGVAGYGTAHVGYRLHPIDWGFNFRVGLMALFGPGLSFSGGDPTAFGVLPWGYLSLGADF